MNAFTQRADVSRFIAKERTRAKHQANGTQRAMRGSFQMPTAMSDLRKSQISLTGGV
jgi:hypothetical protein